MARRAMNKTVTKVPVRLLVAEAHPRGIREPGTVVQLTEKQAANYVELGRGELVEEVTEEKE